MQFIKYINIYKKVILIFNWAQIMISDNYFSKLFVHKLFIDRKIVVKLMSASANEC